MARDKGGTPKIDEGYYSAVSSNYVNGKGNCMILTIARTRSDAWLGTAKNNDDVEEQDNRPTLDIGKLFNSSSQSYIIEGKKK